MSYELRDEDTELSRSRTTSVVHDFGASEVSEWRQWVGVYFVRSHEVQLVMAFAIFANAVIIGCETDMQQYDWLWSIFENVFLWLFTIEIGLRLYYWQYEFFVGKESTSNWFDFFLVALGLVDFVIQVILRLETGQIGLVMKTLRLLRILRLFRLFKMFKQLYLLASGFVESISAVFWVSMLATVMMYICAVCLTRTLGRANHPWTKDPVIEQYCRKNYGSIGRSMFTLFELMANPDFKEIQGIMLGNFAMMMFFVTFIVFGSFAMLSILTGVISESMISKGNDRKEELRFEEERAKDRLMMGLKDHFVASDTDGDGTMTRAEFLQHLPQMIRMFDSHGFRYEEEDLSMIFDLVDFDKGGTVSIGEFLQGMLSFCANMNDLPLQVMKLQSNIFLFNHETQLNLLGRFDNIDKTIRSLDAKVNALTLKANLAPEPPAEEPSRFSFWC